MKTFLWTVVVLAIEVLLLWGCVALVPYWQLPGTTEVLALLVGTVSVVVWLGFNSGFEQTIHRLTRAVVGCVIVSYAGLIMVAFADLPTAVVCARGRTEVEATPHIKGGRFEESRVGPCVFYNPESRPVPGLRGGAGSGD